ncbi:Hg(II)-responsive transcriptional regulator [Billgrantia antri]|uniref:Mercuric resistance operon regulatory protein n=1 Tax=Billgrantia antri TaxID=2846777 RepID=A0ABS6ZLM2_9GAMM|nr:Hg(II)-responsive transcriptional regulator [Halomonas antri]MBW6389824.1 Hg(II)-responsive transcriptional regulator [Halomonas antri]
MPDDSTTMTIGGLAKAASVHVETIRYYQRRGLLPEPKRPPGGIRRYGAADLARLAFVKNAQQLGFSLAEVSELLCLEDGMHCQEASALAETKLRHVQEKIDRLRRIETVLSDLIGRCHAQQGPTGCPLIASLHDEFARKPGNES